MSIICPTVLAEDAHTYRDQLDRVTPFATRIQIDLADGDFAPNRTINPIQAHWSDEILADIHLMFRRPIEHIETLISLKPHLVILHAESDGDIGAMLKHFQEVGIKAGVALLKPSPVEKYQSLLEIADHALLFSGELGHFGGQADMIVLDKVLQVRNIKKDIEIGWDGGVNDKNSQQLADGGVDVLNVGGFIQRASDPRAAYDTLLKSIS